MLSIFENKGGIKKAVLRGIVGNAEGSDNQHLNFAKGAHFKVVSFTAHNAIGKDLNSNLTIGAFFHNFLELIGCYDLTVGGSIGACKIDLDRLKIRKRIRFLRSRGFGSRGFSSRSFSSRHFSSRGGTADNCQHHHHCHQNRDQLFHCVFSFLMHTSTVCKPLLSICYRTTRPDPLPSMRV